MSANDLIAGQRALARRLNTLRFAPPTAYVYNPLDYARAPLEAYLRAYGEGTGRVLLLGMNPGPFGMVQTGVPFGDVTMVRDFLGIEEKVGRPAQEHPARPVLGFAIQRGEVSGARLWGFARERFGTAEKFFRQFFVMNYCPLAFVEAGGKNRTPDKLPSAEQGPLLAACDRTLADAVSVLEPSLVVGIGAFAEACARRALPADTRIGCVLHPSPANPKANSGWSKIVEQQLRELGVKL